MGGRSVPCGPGWRIHPCGRDAGTAIRNLDDREPGEPSSEWRNRGNASTVRRHVVVAAMGATDRLIGRDDSAVAAVVVERNLCRNRRGRHRKAVRMAGQRELRTQECRHRKYRNAQIPSSLAMVGHGSSLLRTGCVALIQIKRAQAQFRPSADRCKEAANSLLRRAGRAEATGWQPARTTGHDAAR